MDNVDSDFRSVQLMSPELMNRISPELVEGDGEKESDEPEFVVIEQGIEIAARISLVNPKWKKLNLWVLVKEEGELATSTC